METPENIFQQRSLFSIVCVVKFEERKKRCVIADSVAFDSASKEKREEKSIPHFSRGWFVGVAMK